MEISQLFARPQHLEWMQYVPQFCTTHVHPSPHGVLAFHPYHFSESTRWLVIFLDFFFGTLLDPRVICRTFTIIPSRTYNKHLRHHTFSLCGLLEPNYFINDSWQGWLRIAIVYYIQVVHHCQRPFGINSSSRDCLTPQLLTCLEPSPTATHWMSLNLGSERLQKSYPHAICLFILHLLSSPY
jgi:hypothetical protein